MVKGSGGKYIFKTAFKILLFMKIVSLIVYRWDWKDVPAVRRKFCPRKGTGLVTGTHFWWLTAVPAPGHLWSLDTCPCVHRHTETHTFFKYLKICLLKQILDHLYILLTWYCWFCLILCFKFRKWSTDGIIVKILEVSAWLSSLSLSSYDWGFAVVSLDKLLCPFCSAPSSCPSLTALSVCIDHPESRHHHDFPEGL